MVILQEQDVEQQDVEQQDVQQQDANPTSPDDPQDSSTNSDPAEEKVFKVLVIADCNCCENKAKGSRCWEQPGNEWMKKGVPDAPIEKHWIENWVQEERTRWEQWKVLHEYLSCCEEDKRVGVIELRFPYCCDSITVRNTHRQDMPFARVKSFFTGDGYQGDEYVGKFPRVVWYGLGELLALDYRFETFAHDDGERIRCTLFRH